MREVWRMWNYSTMVVLTVLTAGIFAAILIPFKGIPLIPGLTELRPANVIPVVFGLLFGPAGAWGAAFGNLIGDFFGTLGVGSFFGFWGNFLAAYLTYKLWGDRPLADLGRHLPRFVGAVVLGAWACALVVGFGVEVFKLLPFCRHRGGGLHQQCGHRPHPGPLAPPLAYAPGEPLGPGLDRADGPRGPPPRPGPPPGPGPGVAGGRRRFLSGLVLGLGLVIIPGLPALPLILIPFLAVLLVGCCAAVRPRLEVEARGAVPTRLVAQASIQCAEAGQI